MSEIKSVFVPVEAFELLAKVRSMKADGYRLGQACATKCKDGHIEVLYSFDKDHSLTNLKVMVPEDMELQSITGEIWSAFIYENEMHDLFGIKFKNLELDYQGNFFRVAQKTPWNTEG